MTISEEVSITDEEKIQSRTYNVQDRQQAVVSLPANNTLSSWSRISSLLADSFAT